MFGEKKNECQFLATDIKADTMGTCGNTSPISHELGGINTLQYNIMVNMSK